MTMSRPLPGMASWRSRPNLLMSWVPVRTETLWPKKAYSPTVMSPEPTLKSALLTTAVGWMRRRARSPWTRYLYISTWASGAGLPRVLLGQRLANRLAQPAAQQPRHQAVKCRHPRLLFLAVQPVDPGRPSIASAVATPEVGDGALVAGNRYERRATGRRLRRPCRPGAGWLRSAADRHHHQPVRVAVDRALAAQPLPAAADVVGGPPQQHGEVRGAVGVTVAVEVHDVDHDPLMPGLPPWR